MLYRQTTATNKILALKKRIRVIQGGTSASKTISILLVLIAMAQSDSVPTVTSIVSESFPHLRRGVIRDFMDIMEKHKYFDPKRWDKTNSIYTFETGSTIEFFSADQPGKVRGPRRDRLFINECNNVPYETFDQLEIRTKSVVFLDYNPTIEFWFYDKVQSRNDVDFLILTYKDNEGLDQAIVQSIEQHKNDKQWWLVYGLGQLGEVETRIYKGWQIIDEIPFGAKLVRRGLDFGYTNDPTACIAIYQYDGGFIWDEEIYQKGLTNKQIADTIKAQEQQCLVIADAAEPKSIDEIRLYGINIVPAIKGSGSVNKGIQFVQGQRMSITKHSVNAIKEQRNYVWITDKDGIILNEPTPFNNHTMDAGRYGMNSLNVIGTQARQFQPASHIGGANRQPRLPR